MDLAPISFVLKRWHIKHVCPQDLSRSLFQILKKYYNLSSDAFHLRHMSFLKGWSSAPAPNWPLWYNVPSTLVSHSKGMSLHCECDMMGTDIVANVTNKTDNTGNAYKKTELMACMPSETDKTRRAGYHFVVSPLKGQTKAKVDD
jgi:hypothetical protein